MPAKMTAEYDLTGLTGANLYAKLKAALVESGAQVYDEYTSGSTYYLVERVLLAEQATGYLRWFITGGSISSPTLFAAWNPASRTGTALIAGQSGSVTSVPYLRAYAGADYRLLQLVSAVSGSVGSYGWMAPAALPTGWNTASAPWIVGIAAGVGGSFSVYTGPQNTALPRFSVSVVPPPTIDPALSGTIGRFTPFCGPAYSTHLWPDDFQVISGRASSDFASLRDSEYSVMVGGEVRTYRALSISGTNAYTLRTT